MPTASLPRLAARAAVVALALLMAACASKQPKQQIIIETYSPPAEWGKVQKMYSESADFSASNGQILSLGVAERVTMSDSLRALAESSGLERALPAKLKEQITETNFISLHPIVSDSVVTLRTSVLAFEYQQPDEFSVKSNLETSFVLSKGGIVFYTKNYQAARNIFEKSAQLVPTRSEVVGALTSEVAEQFIADISPLKTRQVRSFLPMPPELEYVLDFALRKNYRDAIRDLEQYEGEKAYQYHYNLATLYEALASERDDPKYLLPADKNYRLARANGGLEDDVVVAAIARFNNYNELFRLINAQNAANADFESELRQELGIFD